MQAMTAEQNEAWKAAINPLDYLDFHALSDEGLEQSGKRILAGRGAPGWALTARSTLIRNAWKENQLWVPEFALRSEMAMIGLNVLYPTPEAHMTLYRRLLRDFLNRALAPLVEAFTILEELHNVLGAKSQNEVNLKQLRQVLEHKHLEQLAQDRLRGQMRQTAPQVHLKMAAECVELVRLTHFEDPKKWWLRGGLHLGYYLSMWYQLQVEDDALSGFVLEDVPGKVQCQPVADAFLTALEAECPPPDWL